MTEWALPAHLMGFREGWIPLRRERLKDISRNYPQGVRTNPDLSIGRMNKSGVIHMVDEQIKNKRATSSSVSRQSKPGRGRRSAACRAGGGRGPADFAPSCDLGFDGP